MGEQSCSLSGKQLREGDTRNKIHSQKSGLRDLLPPARLHSLESLTPLNGVWCPSGLLHSWSQIPDCDLITSWNLTLSTAELVVWTSTLKIPNPSIYCVFSPSHFSPDHMQTHTHVYTPNVHLSLFQDKLACIDWERQALCIHDYIPKAGKDRTKITTCVRVL